jgi:hypothetical protein
MVGLRGPAVSDREKEILKLEVLQDSRKKRSQVGGPSPLEGQRERF